MTGFKYELKGSTRLAVIHLTPLDPTVLPAEQRSLTIKFHDLENIPDILVLKYYFDNCTFLSNAHTLQSHSYEYICAN